MRLSSVLRKLRVGLAFVAAFASALSPAYAHLAPRGGGAPDAWAEICSVGGMLRVQQDQRGDPRQAPAQDGAHAQDCLYCASLAAALGLPPTAAPGIEAPATQTLPAPRAGPPAGTRAWSNPRSRAPPGLRG